MVKNVHREHGGHIGLKVILATALPFRPRKFFEFLETEKTSCVFCRTSPITEVVSGLSIQPSRGRKDQRSMFWGYFCQPETYLLSTVAYYFVAAFVVAASILTARREIQIYTIKCQSP